MKVKTCSKCFTTKPIEEFNLRNKNSKLYKSWCKLCISTYNKKWKNNNKEKVKEYRAEYYIINEVSAESKRLKQQYDSKYYVKNKDKKNKQYKEYYSIPEISDRIKKNSSKYSKTTKGKVSKSNSEAKRRAILKNTDITTEWLAELKGNSKYCLLCSRVMVEDINSELNKHLDHVIPLNVGGTHTMDNVRYICAKCNLTRPRDGSDVK